MSNKRAFENFIRRHIYAVRGGERCTRFVLRHATATGKVGTEVTTIEAKATDAFIGECCAEMEESAEGDAAGFGGVQTYLVQAYYGDNDKPAARFAIRAAGSDSESEGDDIGTEPATKAGLLAQTMRHNEAIMRTQTMGIGAVLQQLAAITVRQSQQIDSMMEKQYQTMSLLEDANSKRHERDMDLMRENRKAETTAAAIDKLGTLVPFVANKLAGRKLLPAADPRAMQLRQLFGSLSQEQMEAVTGILTPEQALTVVGLAQQFAPPDAPTEKPSKRARK